MKAIQVMSALAQPKRLEVFSQLARVTPDGLSAGAIAALTDTPANTLSAHLAILSRAGLVTSSRHGRSIVYRAADRALEGLITFLLKECCDGDPDQCRHLISQIRLDLGQPAPDAGV